MPEIFEVPLQPTPQSLSISLAGVQYRLTVRWNNVLGAWVLDIADINRVAILSGIPIVPGVDLLGQYAHLALGGQLVALTDGAPDEIPGYTSLGVTGHLYWVTT